MNRQQRNEGRISVTESPIRTWAKFRLLHPYSKDEFSTDPEKLVKWHYHTTARMAMPELKTIVVDNSMLLKIRAKYGVSSFDQMPGYTQAVYNAVAKCFPGFQVYACGSRVRGDYADAGTTPTDVTVTYARKAAGLKHRPNSDYDFWVEPSAIQTRDLPPNTDRARLRIPEKEKVAIPIYYE